MYTRVLGLTISALILAYGAVGAIAQDRMTQQPDQQQMQSHPMGQEDAGTMGQGGMMGRGMMGGGAMGPPIMFRMMFALMDADSDGTISLQGFRRLTKEFSRQWTATKMASLPWRRCKRSCTGPGDRFRGSLTSEQKSWLG